MGFNTQPKIATLLHTDIRNYCLTFAACPQKGTYTLMPLLSSKKPDWIALDMKFNFDT